MFIPSAKHVLRLSCVSPLGKLELVWLFFVLNKSIREAYSRHSVRSFICLRMFVLAITSDSLEITMDIRKTTRWFRVPLPGSLHQVAKVTDNTVPGRKRMFSYKQKTSCSTPRDNQRHSHKGLGKIDVLLLPPSIDHCSSISCLLSNPIAVSVPVVCR